MIQFREITPSDIDTCAALLIEAYNCAPWNDHWTPESASRFLKEFIPAERFKGFIIEEDGQSAGATFGHGRAWWTGDEFYIDEIYISEKFQHRGLGKALLCHVEEYVKSLGLNGVTLLTNRHMPAMEFYKKNGYEEAEHVAFLYKVLK